eukprot:220696_1
MALIIGRNLKTKIHSQLKYVLSNVPTRFNRRFESHQYSIKQIYRILDTCLAIFERAFRSLYWLLAPNMLLKLIMRHMVLFALMFAMPPILRCTIKPFWRFVQYHIIFRITMGSDWVNKYKQIKRQCQEASTYAEYAKFGLKLDEMQGYDAWRIRKKSNLYCYEKIQNHVLQMTKFRDTNQIRCLMQFIRSKILRTYCYITNPQLYSISCIGTKKLIEDFLDNMCQSLHEISQCNGLSLEERIAFVQELRHLLGRTALCLSGGAGLASSHVGVVHTMARNKLLPSIISGASGGAVVAAWVCTRTDFDLEDAKRFLTGIKFHYLFDRPTWYETLSVPLARFWRRRSFEDAALPREAFQSVFGDMTFLEAYQKTGRILNISVSGSGGHTLPRLLNYLTAPNVTIWSAVMASATVPLLYEPQELYTKSRTTNKIEPIFLEGVKFIDGSVSSDLPMKQMAQLFNVDNFIVSQTNPHMILFLFHSIVAPIPLFDTIFTFLGKEFHHYLSAILVYVGGMRFMNDFLTQKWTGDVTIVPSAQVHDYLGFFSNPTPNYVSRLSESGSRATFKHISRLQALCAIEFTIDSCLKKLRSQYYLNRIGGESFGQLNSAAPFVRPRNAETFQGNSDESTLDREVSVERSCEFYLSEFSDLCSDFSQMLDGKHTLINNF